MTKNPRHAVHTILTRRFGAALSVVVVLVVAVATTAADFLIKGSLREVEAASLASGLSLVRRALDRELEGLDSRARGIAEAGVGYGSLDLASLDLDYLALLGPDRGLEFSADRSHGVRALVPGTLLAAASSASDRSESSVPGGHGLIRAPEGLLAFAAQPIPGGGLVVVARRLDGAFVARLRDASLQNLEIAIVGALGRAPDNERAARLEASGGREYRLSGAWEKAEASELLYGSGGELVAVATIRQDRLVRVQTFKNLRILVTANVACALLAITLLRGLFSFAQRQYLGRTEAEKLYRVLVETAPDAILVFGADGRVRFANARAAGLFGRDVGELRGAPFSGFAARADFGILKNHLVNVVASGSDGVELRVARPDGSHVPVEVRSSALSSAEERDLAAISFLRDVSERKAREERILALTEKLRLIARLSQRTGSLLDREDYADLVVDSALVLVPGSLPSFWLAGEGGEEAPGAGLSCARGIEPGSRPREGSVVVEAFREKRPVYR